MGQEKAKRQGGIEQQVQMKERTKEGNYMAQWRSVIG